MSRHLNLEEQEQLAQIKSFWEQYGSFIILLAVALIFSIGGWFGWQYWQNRQAMGASALYDQFQLSITRNDISKTQQLVEQIQSEHGSTGYASLSTLQAATAFHSAGDLDATRTVLTWLVENGKEPGWKAIAVLRLADVLTDQHEYEQALRVLATQVPDAFKPLVEDKRGNVFLAQGQSEEAKQAFISAFNHADLPPALRPLILGKLNLLGVDPSNLTASEEQRT